METLIKGEHGKCKKYMYQQQNASKTVQSPSNPCPSEMEGQLVAEDKCNIEDSLCTSDILDNLQEIEAWETNASPPLISHPFTITTCQDHHVEVLRDQSPIPNLSGPRRSPRIQLLQQNKQKCDVGLKGNTGKGSMIDIVDNGREQNNDFLTSMGNDTLEAIDAMDLDDSMFEKVSVSQLRTEELENHRKTKHNAASHQPSFQILRRSQRHKSMNSKVECTNESINSTRITKGTATHTSGITPVCLTWREPAQDNDLCENIRLSPQEEREIKCSSKILKNLTTHCMESPINQNQTQQEETYSEKKKEKTKNHKDHSLKGVAKTALIIKKNNKENIKNLNDSHEKSIPKSRKSSCDIARGGESSEVSVESVDNSSPPLSPLKEPNPLNERMHQNASLGNCSKKHIISAVKSSALSAESHSLHNNNEHCENVTTNDQQCISKQNSQKKLDYKVLVDEEMQEKQDDKSDNLYSPNIDRQADVPKDSRSRVENIVKSPLSHDTQSILSTQEKMELSAWGLPEAVLKCYLENGVKEMFPWQAECLSLPGVLEGRNLIYSAPTSAGKTLVAELLLLKRVLEGGRKGIFILPFVAVAREKMQHMQKMFGSVGVRVEGFMGSQGPPGGLKSTDIAICTIEKANNLINRLLEDHAVSELGMIVVDELHMLGDPHRGYLLELLLTKLTYVTSMSSAVCSQSPKDKEGNINIQIIGMSATLPNLDLLAGWLNAALYTTDYRPIPLHECVKLGTSLYDSSLKKLRDLSPKMALRGDRDHLMQLCLETVLEGFSVLVFCPSKAWCENLASAVAKEFYQIGKTNGSYPPELGIKLRNALDSAGIRNVLEALRKCPVGLDKILGRSVAFGAAYHHAGLTFDERDIIEGGFRSGSLRVLLATSTLSSGVNLPARRVIIRSPLFGGSILDALTYKQMVGRAGRKGVDLEGESILITRDGEKEMAERLMTSSLPPITSCLQKDASLTSSMKRAILEVIVSGVARTPQEVENYCGHTLLAASMKASQKEGEEDTNPSNAINSLTSCVTFLLENEFIRLQEGGEREEGKVHVGTQLGLAVLASGLSPDEGLHVFSELHCARKCFVLENELHIVYQVTPVYVSAAWPDLDWMSFLRVWESLSEDEKRVAQLVGVEESFIVRALKGVINKRVRRQAQQLAVHRRFYASLALQDLVQEVPLDEVACKFGASRGVLQALQQSAATFAGMVTVFCNRLGWHNLELLVAQFRERLHFGVQRDLCDLVRLSPLLNAQRARHLHSAGLETVAMVASATPVQVEGILHAATPFHSTKLGERATQGTIWLSPSWCVTEAEASALIVTEARKLVQKELGISSIDWNRGMQGPVKPDSKTRDPLGTPQVKRKELVTPVMGMETPHTGATSFGQKVSSFSTTIEKMSAKPTRLNGNWKGLLRNVGKKRKSKSPLNNVNSKTIKEGLFSNQTNSEENSNSAIRKAADRKSAVGEESLSVNIPRMSAEDGSCLKSMNTEKSDKYHDFKKEAGNAVTSNTENKSYDDSIMNREKVDSPSKLSIIDGKTSDSPARLLDVGKNVLDGKIMPKKSEKTTANSTSLLFSNIKRTKEVEACNHKIMSAFVPESQEDKSDNVFSPKHRKMKSSSTSCISKTKGDKDTSCSTSHIDGGNNAAASDGFVGVGSGEDGNISLPHTPFTSGRMKITASSTPIMMPEHHSNQSPAPLLTPGSELAASSVLNFMINADLNDSSDLFSESDAQDFPSDKTNPQEISRNFEGKQAKNIETESSDDGILDQKEHCKIESQELPQNYSTINSNIIESELKRVNSNSKKVYSEDKLCSPVCQIVENIKKLENVNDPEKKSCRLEVKEITTDPCDVLDKKNALGKVFGLNTHVANTLKLTPSPDKHGESLILTDSQKNGLLMTMNSQKSDCPTHSPACHKELHNEQGGENNDLNYLKNSLNYHRELGDEEKKNNNVTIDSGINIKCPSGEFKEQCDTDESLGIGGKRKLHWNAKLDVPTKRLCFTDHSESGNMRDPINHVSSKVNCSSETESDFGSLSYFEKLNLSKDLYLSEDNVDVEVKNADKRLTEISSQGTFLNQPFQTLEKSPNRRNNFENIKEKTSEPKDFVTGLHNDTTSVSFLEKSFESCLPSQYHADDAEIGSRNQDDLEPHCNTVKTSLSQDIQLSMWNDSLVHLCLNLSKHQNKNDEKRMTEMKGRQLKDNRDLLGCAAIKSIPYNREEIAGKPKMNLVFHSNTNLQDVSFSQLDITPNTEALLEGKSFRDNKKEGRLSGDLFLTPPTRTQKKQKNGLMERECTEKSEKILVGNLASPSEGMNTTDSVLHEKASNTVEDNTYRKNIEDDLGNTAQGRIIPNSHCTLPKFSEPHTHQNAELKTDTTSQLSSSTTDSLTSTSSFCIVDVANDSRLFASFVEELHQQSLMSLALACERAPSQKQQQEQCIGWRITGHSRTPRKRMQCKAGQQVAGVLVENCDLMVVGLAVCWGNQDAYYLNLRTSQDEPTSCSLPTPALTDAVPLEQRVEAVKNFFSREKQSVLRMWDAKSSVRLLVGSGLGCVLGPVEDPRVAAWMLDPGAKEPNICNLVMNHNLASLPLLEGVGGSRGLGGLGTTPSNPGSCRVRAAVESVVVFHLTQSLISKLKEVEMLQSFEEVEMRSVVELAYMELNGLGFSNKECESQKCIMQEKLSSLENEAHFLAGHSFSLSSPVEISKVLYGTLHLSHPSSRGSSFAPNVRRRGRGRGRGAGPTNKDALEKLKPHHPLPEILLQWRKINSALTKVVFPLQQVRLRCSQLAMDRIHPATHTFTSTGRITMHEPSLQTIPRDFDIQITVEDNSKHTRKKSLPQHQLCSATMTQLAPFLAPASEKKKQQQHTVSLRHALVARSGHVLLAADYSQLELRLLAHLAGDQPLLQLLNSGGDVFTLLATHLASPTTEITVAQRQQAKQVCYGIIYGMGARALGEQLGMEEEEARILMLQFQSMFPGMQKFTTTTVETARRNGYVTTLLGRRRYLPAIKSACSQTRAQSERQAVNTTIQGSAADLAKLAMVQIQVALRETFPTAPTCLTTSQLSSCQEVSRGAHLVLHLHDELMYEVMSEDVIQVAQLIRKHMEGVLQLSVSLPVKIKVGPSWGSLQTLNL